MSLAPSTPPHVAHLMTFPCLEAYHMTKLFGAGKVGGGWGTKHVVSVPPSTPRSAAIFLPAAAKNVLPQSHTPQLCSQIKVQQRGPKTGSFLPPVALVGRWVEEGQSVFLLSPCPPHERPMPHWIPRRSPTMAADAGKHVEGSGFAWLPGRGKSGNPSSNTCCCSTLTPATNTCVAQWQSATILKKTLMVIQNRFVFSRMQEK